MLARANTLCCWHCCRYLSRRHHHVIKRVARGSHPKLLPQVLLLQIRYVQMTLQNFSTLMKEYRRPISCTGGNKVLPRRPVDTPCRQLTKSSPIHSTDQTEKIKLQKSLKEFSVHDVKEEHDNSDQNLQTSEEFTHMNIEYDNSDQNLQSSNEFSHLKEKHNYSDLNSAENTFIDNDVLERQFNVASKLPIHTGTVYLTTEVPDSKVVQADTKEKYDINPSHHIHNVNSERGKEVDITKEPMVLQFFNIQPDFEEDAPSKNIQSKKPNRRKNKKEVIDTLIGKNLKDIQNNDNMSGHIENLKSDSIPVDNEQDGKHEAVIETETKDYRRSLWLALPNKDIAEVTIRKLSPDILFVKMDEIDDFRFAVLTFISNTHMKKNYTMLASLGLQVEYLDDMKYSILVGVKNVGVAIEHLCKNFDRDVSMSIRDSESSPKDGKWFGIYKFNTDKDRKLILRELRGRKRLKSDMAFVVPSCSVQEYFHRKFDFKRFIQLGNFSSEISAEQLKLLSPDITDVVVKKAEDDLRYAYLQFSHQDSAEKVGKKLRTKGLNVKNPMSLISFKKSCILCVEFDVYSIESLHQLILLENVLECYFMESYFYGGSSEKKYAFLRLGDKMEAQQMRELLMKKGFCNVKHLGQKEGDYKALYVNMDVSGLIAVEQIQNLCKGVEDTDEVHENDQRYTVLKFATEKEAEENYKQLREKGISVGFVTSSMQDVYRSQRPCPEITSRLFIGSLPKLSSRKCLKEIKQIDSNYIDLGQLGPSRFAVVNVQKGHDFIASYFYLKDLGFDVKPLQPTKLEDGCLMVFMKAGKGSVNYNKIFKDIKLRRSEHWFICDGSECFLFCKSEATAMAAVKQLQKIVPRDISIYFMNES